MKNEKVLFYSFTVLVVVAGSLAFKAKSNLSSGSVYCTNTCASSAKVQYKVDPAGSFSADNVCGTGVQPYILNGNTNCHTTERNALFGLTTDLGQ